MADDRYTPRSISVQDEGMHVLWLDGHQCLLPHRVLRGNCGCAACVDEMTHVRHVSVDDVAQDIRVEDVLEVGNYAIGILFSDLHDTGIFPFARLRELCEFEASARPG